MTPTHNAMDQYIRSAAVFEDCLGASVANCPAGFDTRFSADATVLVTSYDGDANATSDLSGLTVNLLDLTTSALNQKGPRRAIEADLGISNGTDASPWDDTCAIRGSDCQETGIISQSTGNHKAGIAFGAGANDLASGGAWQRGALIRDWAQAGIDIKNTYPGSTGWSLVLDDSTGTGIQQIWARGTPNISSNVYFNWVFGPAGNLKLFNGKTGSTTPAFTLNGGGANSVTSLNSFGSSPVTLNVDSRSGSGTEFGNGNGRVVASVSSSGAATFTSITAQTKNFKIDHPLDPANKYLYHTSVESPDMMNIYNGNVVLDANGEAEVQLPDWFEALNEDFRYQLTCIGGFAPVYVAREIENNSFRIAGGKSGLKVSWQVTGIRHDAYAQAHRSPVEVEKPTKERGHYLYPELFSASRDKAIDAH